MRAGPRGQAGLGRDAGGAAGGLAAGSGLAAGCGIGCGMERRGMRGEGGASGWSAGPGSEEGGAAGGRDLDSWLRDAARAGLQDPVAGFQTRPFLPQLEVDLLKAENDRLKVAQASAGSAPGQIPGSIGSTLLVALWAWRSPIPSAQASQTQVPVGRRP